jgi:twitching motility protein PilT
MSISTQRQATQTLDMSNSQRVTNASGVVPTLPTTPQTHRPGTPPPVAGMRPRSNPSGITMEHLIREAFDKGFSDIHLGVGEVPRFRNRGEIETTSYPETDKLTFMSWLEEILTEEEIKRFENNLEFDGATQYEFARIRINVFDSLRGYAMVLRLIPLKILTMEQLNLPTVFRDVCHHHKGLILITGPTI